MKPILIPLLLLLLMPCASTASAQVDSVGSGVYAWAALSTKATPTGEARPILEGVSTPLEHLELQAETLSAGHDSHANADHDGLEELIIVKDGALRISLLGKESVLGPGSVAVILPGDTHKFGNSGDVPATYYVFQYRSREPMDLARGEEAGGSFVLDWNDVEKRDNGTGGRRDFFDRPTAMFERFEMHVSTLSEGLTNHAAHTHGAEEFVVMMRSRVEMLIGEGYQEASEGDVIFLESMIPHALNNLGSGATEYFAFQWQ